MLDSNVYDQLVETPERQLRFVGAYDRGLIELLMTHIQRDELSQIPDAARRNVILAIPFVITPTYGIVLGTSRLAWPGSGIRNASTPFGARPASTRTTRSSPRRRSTKVRYLSPKKDA